MTETQNDAKGSSGSQQPKGIGFGVFLLMAGFALLAERLGWLPGGTDWLFPAILIAWGASEIYSRQSRN